MHGRIRKYCLNEFMFLVRELLFSVCKEKRNTPPIAFVSTPNHPSRNHSSARRLEAPSNKDYIKYSTIKLLIELKEP